MMHVCWVQVLCVIIRSDDCITLIEYNLNLQAKYRQPTCFPEGHSQHKYNIVGLNRIKSLQYHKSIYNSCNFGQLQTFHVLATDMHWDKIRAIFATSAGLVTHTNWDKRKWYVIHLTIYNRNRVETGPLLINVNIKIIRTPQKLIH